MSSENNKMGSAITHQINIYRGAALCQKLEIPRWVQREGGFPSCSILGAISVWRGRKDHRQTITQIHGQFQPWHMLGMCSQGEPVTAWTSPGRRLVKTLLKNLLSSQNLKDDVVAGQQKLLQLFPHFYEVLRQLLPSEVSISCPSPSELTLGLILVNRL